MAAPTATHRPGRPVYPKPRRLKNATLPRPAPNGNPDGNRTSSQQPPQPCHAPKEASSFSFCTHAEEVQDGLRSLSIVPFSVVFALLLLNVLFTLDLGLACLKHSFELRRG